MPCRAVFSGTGMLMEWSRIFALMLSTDCGMWHSTQELPALFARWWVGAVSLAAIAWWHCPQSALFDALSCGFTSILVLCGLEWHVTQVAPPFKKHWLCQNPNASFENRRVRPS